MFLALLVAAAEPPPQPQPIVDLRQRVVEAIRNCKQPITGEIVVCPRDRGFAEGQRVRPLKKPVPVNEPLVRVEVSGGSTGTNRDRPESPQLR